jgi:hypothetical protein
MTTVSIKPIINISNKQINCCLPKKKLTKYEVGEIMKGKRIKLRFMGFE